MAESSPKTAPSGGATSILTASCDFVPCGDGSYRPVPRKPIQEVSVGQAARVTNCPAKTIYRLYRAGLITGRQLSPRKLTINLDSLFSHLKAAADPGFWTKERQLAFYSGFDPSGMLPSHMTDSKLLSSSESGSVILLKTGTRNRKLLYGRVK